MTDNHPITPPPELVQRLCDKAILHAVDGAKRGEIEVWLIQEAFRAGADQELDACCEWLDEGFGDVGNFPATLRAARRPRPKAPSLKEQAFEAQQRLMTGAWRAEDWQLIGRVIEALPDD
jgi:hypothetical protein